MKHANILVIDDDPISLQLLATYLKTEKAYSITTAIDGEDALAVINKYSPGHFSCIISDFMMPKKNGIELLKEIKQDKKRNQIPFILQTSANSPEEIQRGLDEGAFYYLLKPITPSTLLSVVQSALKDLHNRQEFQNTVQNMQVMFPLVKTATFNYQTIQEAKSLSSIIGAFTSDPAGISVGFFEIMINAIEHGNLGITYDEKTQLLNDSELHKEIERRLSLPEYAEKYVSVTLKRSDTELEVAVTDMGNGFKFEDFMEFSIERAMDNHGRGIMMANSLSFDQLLYSNGGRTATCITSKLSS